MYREAFREIGILPKMVILLGKVPSYMTGTWHCAKSCAHFDNLPSKSRDIGAGM